MSFHSPNWHETDVRETPVEIELLVSDGERIDIDILELQEEILPPKWKRGEVKALFWHHLPDLPQPKKEKQ